MRDHGWFASRMLAHAAGLLTDEELERFQDLLDTDESCAQLWREFLGEPDETDGECHLPAALIAQWPKASDSLATLERQAVEDHLAHCDRCAEEVALFGSAARAAEKDQTPRRVGTPTPRRDQWRVALSGGIVGALAMAAVLLLMLSPSPEPEADGALPWAAPTRVRSDELPAFARVTVGVEARQIGLNLAVPQSLDRIRPAEISIFGPDLALLQRFTAPASELQRGALMLLLRSETAFASGSYRALFVQAEIESELWFEVERPTGQ